MHNKKVWGNKITLEINFSKALCTETHYCTTWVWVKLPLKLALNKTNLLYCKKKSLQEKKKKEKYYKMTWKKKWKLEENDMCHIDCKKMTYVKKWSCFIIVDSSFYLYFNFR